MRFRWKKSGSRRWRTMELDALEFLRRFLQHVLPPGLQKVRHYGFLSPQSSISHEEVRALVMAENAAAHDFTAAPPDDLSASPITEPTCWHCGHRLRVVAIVFHRVLIDDSG